MNNTRREKSSGAEKTHFSAGPVGVLSSACLRTSRQIHKVHRGFLGFVVLVFLLSETNKGLSAAFELFVFRGKDQGKEGAVDGTVDT